MPGTHPLRPDTARQVRNDSNSTANPHHSSDGRRDTEDSRCRRRYLELEPAQELAQVLAQDVVD